MLHQFTSRLSFICLFDSNEWTIKQLKIVQKCKTVDLDPCHRSQVVEGYTEKVWKGGSEAVL